MRALFFRLTPILLLCLPTSLNAQDLRGNSSFVPSGGGIGGYLPYTSGPGGGLGAQPRRTDPMVQSPRRSLGMTGGMISPLGSVTRSGIVPLSPIRAGGVMPTMTRPAPTRNLTRPPVGFYPFRQPGSLFGPGTALMAM